MKKQLLILISFFTFSQTFAQEFITTWKTDNPGASNATSITIPTFPGETYKYDVDWDNDGTYNFTDIGYTGDATHDFGTPGTYTIAIRPSLSNGAFPRIYFNGGGDRDKILSIDQWGNIGWTSMSGAFFGASNLVVNASDSPNLVNVLDMSNMFSGAASLNQDIGDWNVSSVTNMTGMFSGATSFNQDIGTWDTEIVTNMFNMFRNAFAFNQDIGDWNVINVDTMFGMFADATSFNQDIGDWNVANVEDFGSMFRGATAFNQDIGDWNTSSATNMNAMFFIAPSFDQNIGGWNMESVTDVTNMFIGSGASMSTSNYDALLTGWNAQNLQPNLTFNASAFKYCNGTSARANMIASDGWNILDAGEDCAGIYFITTWKTDNPGSTNSSSIRITLPGIIGQTVNYDIDWESDGAFDDIGVNGSITHDYGTPGTYTVSIRGLFPAIIFVGGDGSKIISIDQWGTNPWVTMGFAFATTNNLVGNATDVPNLSNVTSLSGMFISSSFNQDIGNWDTSNITDMSTMFGQAQMFNQNIGGWDVSNVTDMEFMFQGATAFDQDIGGWNVENVSNFNLMFQGVTLSSTNYDALLIDWDAQNLNSNLSFDGGNSEYCTVAAETARNNMINSDGWTITDGGACIALSVNQFELANTIALFPNPSNSQFAIKGLTQEAKITILDITGKTILSIEKYLDETIDISTLNSGLYLVKVTNKTSSKTLKVLVD